MKISKMYSKNNICFVPTYYCNVDCPFCYAKTFRRRFKQEMSWEVFKKVVNFIIKKGKNEISFLGGEPTIWPYIDRAVSYLKERKIQVNFFTNGIIYSTVAPDCVLINIYNGFNFNNGFREKIEKTIQFYKKNKVEIGLRYNLFDNNLFSSSKLKDKNRSLEDINWFFNLAISSADYISISPVISYLPSRELGNKIFKLAKDFHLYKKTVKISRAIPICLFSLEQFRYLRRKCFLHVKCYSNKNIVINPDGKTLFPCVNISLFTKNLFKEGWQTIQDDYGRFFDHLGRIYPFDRCKRCFYALDNRCQAGCLALRSKKDIRTAAKKVRALPLCHGVNI